MNRPLTSLLTLAVACGPNAPPVTELMSHVDPKPTGIRLRIVDGASPVEGLEVVAISGVRERVGSAVTGSDGVAFIDTSRSGNLWLIANDGKGRGVVLFFTAQPGGRNDAGERPLRPLAEQPDIVQLKGVGFEERVTVGGAGERIAWFLPMERGTRLLSLHDTGNSAIERGWLLDTDAETGEQRIIADASQPESSGPRLLALQRIDDRYAVWSSVRNDQGHTLYAFAIYDARERREVGRIERRPPVPVRASSAMALDASAVWPVGGRFTFLVTAYDARRDLAEPMTMDAVTLDPTTGATFEAALITRPPMLPTLGRAQFINGPVVTDDTVLIRIQGGSTLLERLLVLDRRTLAVVADRDLGTANAQPYPGSPCVLMRSRSGPYRVWVYDPATGAEWTLFEGMTEMSRWGTIDPSGRFFFSSEVDGVRQVAEGTCGEAPRLWPWPETATFPGVNGFPYFPPGEDPLLFRMVDANGPNSEQVFEVWRWRVGAVEPVYQSLPTASVSWVTFPLFNASTADSSLPQLYLGVPGPERPHTWLRRQRDSAVLASDARTAFYVMDDPLTGTSQVFRYAFPEVSP